MFHELLLCISAQKSSKAKLTILDDYFQEAKKKDSSYLLSQINGLRDKQEDDVMIGLYFILFTKFFSLSSNLDDR